MDNKSIKVEIFGSEYTLKSETSAEYIEKISSIVDEKMHKLAEESKIKSPGKIAVLAALNIADDLYQLSDKYERLIENFENKSKELSERITILLDKSLETKK